MVRKKDTIYIYIYICICIFFVRLLAGGVVCISHNLHPAAGYIEACTLFFFFECLALALQQMPLSWCYYKSHHASCASTVLKTHTIDAVLKC